MYDTELKDFAEEEATVAALYQQKVVMQTPKPVVTGKVNTSTNVSYQKTPISLNLIKPISELLHLDLELKVVEELVIIQD